MDNEDINVAIIMGKCAIGGVRSYLIGLLKKLQNYEFKITVVVFEGYSEKDAEALRDLGVRLESVPSPNNPVAHFRELQSLFRLGNYQIVHSLLNTLNIIPLAAAASVGIPVRISENLSSGNPRELKSWIKYILRPFSGAFATSYAANSQLAAQWMWGKHAKQATILNNPIDLDYYRFDEEERKQTRRNLGIPDESLVIGWIGRIVPQKNPLFLADILFELVKQRPDSTLLAMGYGPLKEAFENRVEKLNLTGSVILFPSSESIRPIYQASDVFVMPSIYEGLPIVGVEAQAMGLPCVFSSDITREVAVGEGCAFLSTHDSARKWANTILAVASQGRVDNKSALKKRCFEEGQVASQLAALWHDALKHAKK